MNVVHTHSVVYSKHNLTSTVMFTAYSIPLFITMYYVALLLRLFVVPSNSTHSKHPAQNNASFLNSINRHNRQVSIGGQARKWVWPTKMGVINTSGCGLNTSCSFIN